MGCMERSRENWPSSFIVGAPPKKPKKGLDKPFTLG